MRNSRDGGLQFRVGSLVPKVVEQHKSWSSSAKGSVVVP